MKPLSEVAPGVLVIQIQIQAVCILLAKFGGLIMYIPGSAGPGLNKLFVQALALKLCKRHQWNAFYKVIHYRTRATITRSWLLTTLKYKPRILSSKGPGAKNATRESPGSFNQILNFESWKWSPVATFESGSNKSALSFFDFQLFHVQKQVLTQIVTILGHFFPL